MSEEIELAAAPLSSLCPLAYEGDFAGSKLWWKEMQMGGDLCEINETDFFETNLHVQTFSKKL